MHPALTTAGRPVLDLPTLEGWKAELTYVVGYTKCWSHGVQDQCITTKSYHYRVVDVMIRHLVDRKTVVILSLLSWSFGNKIVALNCIFNGLRSCRQRPGVS